MAQSILTNTAIASSGRVVSVGLGIVVTALVTRLLGPTDYGSYVLLLSLGLVVQLVADGGLYLTLTRDIAASPQQEGVLLSRVVSLRLLLLLVVFTIAVVVSRSVPSLAGLTLPFIVIAVALSAQSFSQLFMGVFQHHQEVWRAVAGDLVGRGIHLGAIVVIASANVTVLAMTLVLAGSALGALLLHHLLLPAGVRWHLVWAPQAWRQLWRRSWPLGALLLLNAIYFRIDTVVLSQFRTLTEVGWYGLAYRIIESGLFFPAMFGGLLLPRLAAQLHRRDREGAGALLGEALQMAVAAGLLAIAVLLAAGPQLVVLVAGDAYVPAGPLLQLLSLALGVMCVGNVLGFALVALAEQRSLLVLYALLAIANTLGNILLIPHWGAAAAAWTTIATEATATAVAAYLVRRHLAVPLSGRFLVTATLLALGVAAALWLLPAAWPVLLKVGGVLILYVAVGHMLGMFTKRTLRLLRSVPSDHIAGEHV